MKLDWKTMENKANLERERELELKLELENFILQGL